MILLKNSAQARSEESKKGFTLTEIAIVLGVIGLILGAIWVAASSVYSSTNANNFAQQMGQYIAAVRAACNNNCTTGGSVPTVTSGIPTVNNSLVTTTTPAPTIDANGNVVIVYTMPAAMNKYATAVAQGLVAASNVTKSSFSSGTTVQPNGTPTCGAGTPKVVTCPTPPANYVYTLSSPATTCVGTTLPAGATCLPTYSGTVAASGQYAFGFAQSF